MDLTELTIFVKARIAVFLGTDGKLYTDGNVDPIFKLGDVAGPVGATGETGDQGFGIDAGAVMSFARGTPPSGWLKANGTLISRTTYATLFAAIGTTFGVGDGSTTFAVPDLRGEFLRGWDDGRGVDTGRTFGSTQNDYFKSHTHSRDLSIVTAGASGGATKVVVGGSTEYNGVTGGTETRPRNIALLVCIKY